MEIMVVMVVIFGKYCSSIYQNSQYTIYIYLNLTYLNVVFEEKLVINVSTIYISLFKRFYIRKQLRSKHLLQFYTLESIF